MRSRLSVIEPSKGDLSELHSFVGGDAQMQFNFSRPRSNPAIWLTSGELNAENFQVQMESEFLFFFFLIKFDPALVWLLFCSYGS